MVVEFLMARLLHQVPAAPGRQEARLIIVVSNQQEPAVLMMGEVSYLMLKLLVWFLASFKANLECETSHAPMPATQLEMKNSSCQNLDNYKPFTHSDKHVQL